MPIIHLNSTSEAVILAHKVGGDVTTGFRISTAGLAVLAALDEKKNGHYDGTYVRIGDSRYAVLHDDADGTYRSNRKN